MKGNLAILADHAIQNPEILKEIVENPNKVAFRFSLNDTEAKALRNNDFNIIGISMGVSRSSRASNHDDAYLS